MIDPHQFRAQILQPVLGVLAGVMKEPWLSAPTAQALLMATAAVESRLGTDLVQIGGPAKNIYQMEPIGAAAPWAALMEPEWNDVFVAFRLNRNWSATDALTVSVTDLALATVLARIFYWLKPFHLPTDITRAGLWEIYKTYWNTTVGATTEAEFVSAVNTYCDFKI